MNRIIIISLLLFANIISFSQQYNFKNFSIEEGLSNAIAYEIYQDSKGYMWVGTSGGGVNRFDGNKFTHFSTKDSLAGNEVRSIIEDSKGNIWIGTEGGVSIYNGFSFFNITSKNGYPDKGVALALYEDSNNNMWVGTSESGLLKVIYDGKDSVDVKVYNKAKNGIMSSTVFDITEDDFGNFWLALYGGGVNILSFEGDSLINVKKLDADYGHIPHNFVFSVTKAKNGDMLFGSYNGAFKIITSGSDSGKVIPYIINLELVDRIVWDIVESDDATIWLATNSDGLINIKDNKVISYKEKNGLIDNQVLSLYQDLEGNIWFGTGKGISKFLGEHLWHMTELEGLSSDVIYAIEQDSAGVFWIGTYDKGLNRVEFFNDSFSIKTYTDEDGLVDNSIRSLDFAPNGNLWIGTDNGVSEFDGKSFKNFKLEIEHNNQVIEVKTVNSIYADSKGYVLCGTRFGFGNLVNGKFQNMDDSDDLPNIEVQTIVETKNGQIWLGTLGCVARTDLVKLQYYDEEEGFYDKRVHTIEEDYKGNIWIGTSGGGVYVHDAKTKNKISFKKIIDDSKITSNNINSLKFLYKHTLIIGTDKGFDRVSLDDSLNVISVKSYNKSDGFVGVENFQNSIYKDSYNRIWMGTPKGLTCYDFNKEAINNQEPFIHIDDILLHDSINISVSNDLYNLEYYDNRVTFKYTGISLSNPDKIRYKYILKGIDKNWSKITRITEITYPGLPNGKYEFQVVAINENGIETSVPASFKFVIKPPFWKTIWFFALCIIVIVLSSIAYTRIRLKKLEEAKKNLEIKVAERTEEILTQKEEIEKQRDEIFEQKKEIVSSIHYAERIQRALLPKNEDINEILEEYFILFKPRDIVSGDYYWIVEKEGRIYATAADCTGHGVPGAFMSMLGLAFLDEIVNKNNVGNADVVLNNLRNNVVRALNQTGEEGNSKDGMDMSLIIIDKEKGMAQYAGAYNPLYQIRDGELIEFGADRMPVGYYMKMDKMFTLKEFEIKKGDIYYMFSDGFVDQFGGPRGKKFMSKKFKRLLLENSEKPMSEQREILDTTIENWKGDTYEQIDDIVVLGIKI